MLASTLMLIALLCAGVIIPVPYSEMSPGPTVNTLGKHDGEPVLQISGRKTYATTGHLNMTTVRVTSADYRMNLVEAVYGWLTWRTGSILWGALAHVYIVTLIIVVTSGGVLG